MKHPPTTDLNSRQRHLLGSAVDCTRDAGSHLAALVASNPPLWYRLVALSVLVLIAQCERRLAAAFNTPEPEPQPQPASIERVA